MYTLIFVDQEDRYRLLRESDLGLCLEAYQAVNNASLILVIVEGKKREKIYEATSYQAHCKHLRERLGFREVSQINYKLTSAFQNVPAYKE